MLSLVLWRPLARLPPAWLCAPGRTRKRKPPFIAVVARPRNDPQSKVASQFESLAVLGSPIPARRGMIPPVKITDRRIMKTTQIATVVVCGVLIGYLSAQVSRSAQDWVLLASMIVVLVCDLFVMFNDVWKQNAPRP
jgi:hypothetical protein